MGGMGSPDAQARERYRNTLFDREAKAATALLEQVRQYVGRSGKCHVTDFEDLCTIHHAISNLYERVRRFSNLETMPRVYRSAVKAPPAPQQRCAAQEPVEPELLMLHGSDALEGDPEMGVGAAAEAQSSPPLFDLVRKVPEVSMEAMNWLLHCPQIDFESLYFDSKIAQIAETSEHMGGIHWAAGWVGCAMHSIALACLAFVSFADEFPEAVEEDALV
ncbi:EF-hand domain-containing protein [Durusdinium trenchii]|uniref:EF-hand domain-containing protein n=1 Tax=Durusdinium trenchii TaxID=1381693 RepID=A0ABP0KPD5_9DINO